MKIVRLIVIALVFTGLAHSCTNRNASEVAEKENQKISYDDSVYCFNGRWRIISNGLEGLSDGNGNVLIEPLYDEIYFLNDNIAVLERSGFTILQVGMVGCSPKVQTRSLLRHQLLSSMKKC